MSKNFQVDDSQLNKGRNYSMDSDLLRGFNSARRNGQVRLALEYMGLIANIVDDQLSNACECQCKCDCHDKADQPVVASKAKEEEDEPKASTQKKPAAKKPSSPKRATRQPVQKVEDEKDDSKED